MANDAKKNSQVPFFRPESRKTYCIFLNWPFELIYMPN